MSPPPPGYPMQPAPYGQPYGLPDAQGATLSMVLGIVALALSWLACCCVVGIVIPLGLGIAALVLGFQARNRVAAAPGALGGGGKALAGIITGGTAVGLAIVLLIVSLVANVGLHSLVNAFPSPT